MIQYLNGIDLFGNLPDGPDIMIPHVCNNIWAWGAGFVVPLGKKYPAARQAYLDRTVLELGTTQFIQVEPKITVANMVAQHKIRREGSLPPIRYDALRTCMEQVKAECEKKPGTVIHCPKFGCGLAGGDPKTIEDMIAEIWKDLEVTVYSL